MKATRHETGAQRSFRADRGDARQRLDRVLVRHLADLHLSRSRARSWIEEGRVRIEGQPASRAATRVARGQRVEIRLPPSPETRRRPEPEDGPLAVLFEDDHLLAVNKPPGTLVHPTPGHHHGTLLNALLAHARSWSGDRRPRLVQRLDRDTSGVLLVAKHREIHAALQKALTGSDAVKEYLALVYGVPARAKDRIDLRIDRHPDDLRRMQASHHRGLPAATRFEVLGNRHGLSLLACRLETGRTHQIRVHLAASGWPLVGDRLYGGPRWKGIVDPVLARTCRSFGRQALHARRLTFTHPVEREKLTVEAPIPSDLVDLLHTLGLGHPFEKHHPGAGVASRRGSTSGPWT